MAADRSNVVRLADARLRRQVEESLAAAASFDPLPPEPRFGGAHLEGDRVVVHAVASMTPAAAEALARQLNILAKQAREARRGL